jgi:hypothetical protein
MNTLDKRITQFIAKAKKQAYASTDSKPKKTKDGGKTYSIREENLLYTDTYFGNIIDSGQERVYYKGQVIWVMAYRGGIFDQYQHLHQEAFAFLKKCMSKIPKQFPARGPKSVKIGKFRYENKWTGNIEGFVGEENIYYDGNKICFRNYVGGLIKNKK